MSRDKIKVPNEISQHSALVKTRSRAKLKDERRNVMAHMIAASEPMRRFAERYERPIIGIALSVAWQTADGAGGLISSDDTINLANALAWLDVDRKNRVRTLKIIELIQCFGSGLIVSALSDKHARSWLEGKL